MSEETARKVVIVRSDVPEDMSGKIVKNINDALDKFQIEKVRCMKPGYV